MSEAHEGRLELIKLLLPKALVLAYKSYDDKAFPY